MNAPMGVVRIDIYDDEGKKVSFERLEPDFERLKDYMKRIIWEDGIPVVRMEQPLVNKAEEGACSDPRSLPFRQYKPFAWANANNANPVLMRLEMKVDQQTLACEGFGPDVIKAQERFLKAIMPEFDGE